MSRILQISSRRHDAFKVGEWTIEPSLNLATKDGLAVHLRPRVMDLLACLAAHADEVVPKQQLLDEVWATEFVSESSLTTAITELRHALGDGEERSRLLETIPKRGYRLVAPVRSVTEEAATVRSLPRSVEAGAKDACRTSALEGQHAPPSAAAAGATEPQVLIAPVRTAAWWSPQGLHVRPARWMRGALVAGGMLVVVPIAVLVLPRLLSHASPPAAVVYTTLDVRPAERLEGGQFWKPTVPMPGGRMTAFAWTPGGRALVFAGATKKAKLLYLRTLDSPIGRAIPGTEGAEVPAVSTDGRTLAFWSNWAIRKLPLAGGVPEVVVPIQAPPAGMAWASDGTLFFGVADADALRPTPILQVGPDGTVSELTRIADTELRHQLPIVLPGDRAVLYTVRRQARIWGDDEIVAHVRATGERRRLLRDAADARYVASGHLLFMRRGALFAVPFDPDRIEIRGEPVAVLTNVAQAIVGDYPSDITGSGQFAVSSAGTLAWVAAETMAAPDATLLAVDRTGRETPIPAPVGPYSQSVRVSPDGGRLAVTASTLFQESLSIYDLTRGSLTPVFVKGEVFSTTWMPDGRRLTFSRLEGGRRSLVWTSAAGDGGPHVLEASDSAPQLYPASWSPDGRHLLGVTSTGDIWSVTEERSGLTRRLLLEALPWHWAPEFSPDGGYLAYDDYTTGAVQVYVQPYPGPGPRVQVSAGSLFDEQAFRPSTFQAGRNPAWNRNGRELFYLFETPDVMRMMAVSVDRTSDGLVVGRPRVLFEKKEWTGCIPTRCYDVAPDGQQFYFVVRPQPTELPLVTHINLAENWVEELKAKVPSGSRH